jgi:MoaA/NifB/PqqE/SkfB family radical SAM enzyme
MLHLLTTLHRPDTVIMDLTSRCNLRCVMCYFSEVDRLSFEPYDRTLSDNGDMPLEVFETVAEELFPKAWRVALGCAAEPMLHPKFIEILGIAARHRVPELWFPTNLLALTRAKAEAIVDARVAVVAASIDGTRQETYEAIRAGARWDRLMEKLELLREVRRERDSSTPALRIIFTWMQSNRKDLLDLPRFAAEQGASELDVRFVTPAPGVDNSGQYLSGEDQSQLRAELREAAHDAVARGIRLASWPEMYHADERPQGLVGKVSHRFWNMRAGLERGEYLRHQFLQAKDGCAYPGRTFVVRPNGAVSPCIFWEEEAVGFLPEMTRDAILAGEPLGAIREGLRCGDAIGTCTRCDQKRDAFYRPERVKG